MVLGIRGQTELLCRPFYEYTLLLLYIASPSKITINIVSDVVCDGNDDHVDDDDDDDHDDNVDRDDVRK